MHSSRKKLKTIGEQNQRKPPPKGKIPARGPKSYHSARNCAILKKNRGGLRCPATQYRKGGIPMLTNETLHTLETRRSCRAYQDRPVDPEALAAVVRAGTFAPTGMGGQSPVIVVVQDKATRDTLSRLNDD